MKSNNLKDRTKQFGLPVLKYLEKLPSKQPYFSMANQLTRNSTSEVQITDQRIEVNRQQILLISSKLSKKNVMKRCSFLRY